MKKILFLFLLLATSSAQSQIICIFCFDQNDSISQNVNNLILNGGFENSTCVPLNDRYCPNSAGYNCDILNWTCTGGGSSTYACIIDDVFYSTLVEGTHLAYFGNSFCTACSPSTNDTSCVLDSTSCTATGIPVGYPSNTSSLGGSVGVSLEQTVSGLVVGNTYVLEFWTGGEWPQTYPNRGLFAVDVGFGKTYLRNKPYHTPSVSTRFIIEFNAVSTSHTIKYTSWGHICSDCTELMLDDVRLYTLAELSPLVPSCSNIPVAGFNSPNNLCPGTCTDFTNLSSGATSFQWSFPGAVPSTSTDVNPLNICYAIPGNYDVQLIATSATGSDTLLLSNFITVYPTPAPQGIMQVGDTLIANQGAASYQWYYNGNLIPGATDYNYLATSNGDYNVVATDNNGCEVEAVINDVLVNVQSVDGSSRLAIFPNPVTEKLIVKSCTLIGTANAEISIYNLMGEKIELPVDREQWTVDCRSLPPGIYFLEMTSHEKSCRAKFIKSTLVRQ